MTRIRPALQQPSPPKDHSRLTTEPSPFNVLTRHHSGVVLEKVCEYLYYKQKYAEAQEVPDMDIPPEICLELLIAGDYLDC